MVVLVGPENPAAQEDQATLERKDNPAATESQDLMA